MKRFIRPEEWFIAALVAPVVLAVFVWWNPGSWSIIDWIMVMG